MSCSCLTTPFIKYLDALQRLLNNEQFPVCFTADGLLLLDMQNRSKVTIVQAKIPRALFRRFVCPPDTRRHFALPAADLGKLLTKVLPSGDDHVLTLDFDDDHCLFRVDRDGVLQARHLMHLFDYQPLVVDIESAPPPTHQLSMSLRDFCHCVSRLALFHTHLQLMLVQQPDSASVVFRARSDAGGCLAASHLVHSIDAARNELVLFPDDDDDDEADDDCDSLLKDMHCDDARVFVSPSYNLKFLGAVALVCPFADDVAVLFCPDFPLRLQFALHAGLGQLDYLVSPELEP